MLEDKQEGGGQLRSKCTVCTMSSLPLEKSDVKCSGIVRILVLLSGSVFLDAHQDERNGCQLLG